MACNFKIGIIILNYLAYKATIECVNDFCGLEQMNITIKIVIVDNCSTNDSFLKLKEQFDTDERIKVVKTASNIGFANGNNFGYGELIKGFIPDFVIIANDDIILPDKSLLSWIIESDEKYHFAVLGPSVYSVNGKYYQSPLENFSTKRKTCLNELFHLYISLFKVRIKLLLQMNDRRIREKKYHDADYKIFTDKKTLHGSFLVFSKQYFEYYDEPFDPGTFLYMEENILRLRCDKMQDLKMVYSPDYCVYHLQSVATNMISEQQTTRDYFRIKNIIKSLKYYITLIK